MFGRCFWLARGRLRVRGLDDLAKHQARGRCSDGSTDPNQLRSQSQQLVSAAGFSRSAVLLLIFGASAREGKTREREETNAQEHLLVGIADVEPPSNSLRQDRRQMRFDLR